MNHTHACADCAHVWQCFEKLDKHGRCSVARAARVAKLGPYCRLCCALAEAHQLAALRGIDLHMLLVETSKRATARRRA